MSSSGVASYVQDSFFRETHRKGILQNRKERDRLFRRFKKKLRRNEDLTRPLVSFQANKATPFYRWFKYKEAFSSDLVVYLLSHYGPRELKGLEVLDPFSGVGTTLTTSARLGCRSTGIEIMPIGVAATRARLIAQSVNVEDFKKELARVQGFNSSHEKGCEYQFPHLRITMRAFPKRTERALSAYQAFLGDIGNPDVKFLFWFACLTVLEDVSYTRKDGQYLRWDNRSGRKLKSQFSKGHIPSFKEAILSKLECMLEDIETRNGHTINDQTRVIQASCIEELLNIDSSSFDMVLTSPPYCNRYDYTRTYALELAFLEYSEEEVKELRQSLLSCTVENKSKKEYLENLYQKRGHQELKKAMSAFSESRALGEVLNLLYQARNEGRLNNSSIPHLVQNYFFEMSVVIHELSRVLRPGGKILMVNDNVQYNGEETPVDLILSQFAKSAGLSVEEILILPRGKGNSSQQMGAHGRNEIRKCVYVWRRNE